MPLITKDLAANIDRAARLLRIVNYSRQAVLGPLCVDVSITSHCNYHCYFCATHSYLRDQNMSHERLPLRVIQDLFKDCAALGVREILLAGNGEPFLIKELLDLLSEYGKKIKFKILTNGSLLREESLKTIHDNLYKLTISLNTIDPETHRVIHGYKGPSQLSSILNIIESLLDMPGARSKLQINYVLTKDNLNEFDDVIEYSIKKDLFFAIRPMAVGFPEVESKAISPEDLQRIVTITGKRLRDRRLTSFSRYTLQFAQDSCRTTTERLEKSDQLLPCYSGFYWGFITSDGLYRMCCHCDAAFGNIKEENFMTVWQRSATQSHIYHAAVMNKHGEPFCEKCFGCVDAHAYSALFHRHVMAMPLQERLLTRRWRQKTNRLGA